MKQNINILLRNVKIMVLRIWKIQRFCLNIQIQVYKNNKEYNLGRKCNLLIVFGDMTDYKISNK